MYINLMNEENKNIYLSNWILLITFLVAMMIVIGGLTRLTDSGLSITKWDLFVGILPPLTTETWNKSFLLYQQIPEYKLINSSMTLDEFKVIYWWEYIHRLLGRIIGIFFLVPLIYFTIKKYLNKNYLFSLYFIFFLIIFQGFLGWYMVQSGLTERTDVSHYRLSIHLFVAFIIFTYLLWIYFNLNLDKFFIQKTKVPFYLPHILLILIFIQIIIGAFVSGLDAGQIYKTWPLMNENYFPDDSNFKEIFTLKVFESRSLLQFIHRNIAYLIFFIFFIIFVLIFSKDEFFYLKRNALIILLSLVAQILLGILTIITGAHIAIASMHQIGSIVLVLTSLILVFKNSKTN